MSMLTPEQIFELCKTTPLTVADGVVGISETDFHALLGMASRLLDVWEWGNVASGIHDANTAGGYSNAQFDVRNIIDGERVEA